MIKLKKISQLLGKRNIMLSLVALILILLTTVSVSYSWIEEVSNVEINTSADAQQTPLNISGKTLDSQVDVKEKGATVSSVNLNNYLSESGDIHLSECYSDGTNFYFPKRGSGASGYRTGTKDDANTNYISITFKVKSHNAPTSYWFEYLDKKSSNLFTKAKVYDSNGDLVDSSTASALKDKLRISVASSNGKPTVYGFNDSGQYTYIDNNGVLQTATTNDNDATPEPRPVKKFMYYDETHPNNSVVINQMTYNNTDKKWENTDDPNGNLLGTWKKNDNNNATNKPNQGEKNNLNGNTILTVGKNQTETVTIKIWLEAGGTDASSVTAVDATDLNLQITSSWAKTRKIYVRDKTMKEPSNPNDRWLKNSTAKLYWGLKNDNAYTELCEMTRIVDPSNSNKKSDTYYAEIPAVYNGQECAFFRYENSFVNNGTGYLNCWVTEFPNTFHDETYSVYSSKYASWSDIEASAVFFVDSCSFEAVTDVTPLVYLWDDKSSFGDGSAGNQVVNNGDWPGVELTKMNWDGGKSDFKVWTFFYASDFDRAIFNDGRSAGVGTNNAEYQTQNLHNYWGNNNQTSWSGKYFDMATLDWFSGGVPSLPQYTNNYLHSNIQGGDNWTDTNFVYLKDGNDDYGVNGSIVNTWDKKEVCRVYVKYAGDYKFKVKLGSQEFGYGDSDGGHTMNKKDTLTLYPNNPNAVKVHFPTSYRIYRFYLEFETKNIDGQNRQCPKLYFANDEDTQ